VDGVVTDPQRRPVAGIQAVLVPDRRTRTDLFKRAVSDRNGRFNISGVAPGGYRLFAFANLEDYAYFDPALLQRFDARGQVVEVSELSGQTFELSVIDGEQP
jgi:hypothetical protein